MPEIKERRLETSVLVIGAEVMIVSKGGFPSGCTSVAMGEMLAAFDRQDSTDRHFEDTIRGGVSAVEVDKKGSVGSRQVVGAPSENDLNTSHFKCSSKNVADQ